MKKPYKLLIFDFDDTLGDTKECVVVSFQQALVKNGLQVADRNRIIHHMGLSLREVFYKTEFAIRSCEYLGISSYFDLYIGDDMVVQKKPHPEMLLHTLKELRVDKTQAVMIGDATTDIEMGNAIDMDTIAVTWGAHSEQLLRTAHPTKVVHKFSELYSYS